MSNKITVTAVVNSDVKTVWNYYNNPDHIMKWNFADPSWQCPSVSNDMQVGGKYSARMEAKDGSFGFDFEAIYDEIVEGEKFAYTMPDGRQAMVAFDEEGNQTKVAVTFDPEQQNEIEMQKSGWQAILDSFKRYAEAQPKLNPN